MWVRNSARIFSKETKTDGVGAARRIVPLAARSLAAVLVFGIPIGAQSPGIPIQPSPDRGQPNSHLPTRQTPDDPINTEMQAKQIKALNQMRHKAMVDDASKLLLLAKQLNDDSANLSPADRVHKAAEIEKLARSVKEKMSYVMGSENRPPVFSVTSP